MNNEDLVLKMILDESGFSAGMDKAVKQLGKFDGQVENTSQRGGRSLGGIWTSFVGNFLASGATKIISTGIGMITSSIGTAINRVDTLNNSSRVFENMGFTAKETGKAMKDLEKDIKGLPTTLDGAVKGVQLLSSTTGDLGKAEQVFTALNNGILGFGGNAEMVDSAVLQLSQAFSNGKVDAGTWNSMMNAQLGPTLNALAKQMGYTTGELKSGLSEGSISVEQFQDALIDLNKNGGGGLKSLEQIAKDSTAGLQTGLANMKSAIVRGVAEAIVKIDEGLSQYGTSISQILADIGSGFESGLKTAAEKIPPIMKAISDAFAFVKDNGDWLIPILVGLTSAFIGLGAVNKVASTISSISSALGILKGAAAFLVSGPGLAIVGISLLIAAGVALYKNWDEVSKYAKKIWGDLSKYFKETFDNIKKWFSETWTGFKDKAKEASDGVKNAWNGVKDWFKGLIDDIVQGFKNGWNSAVESIINLKDRVVNVFTDIIGSIVEFKDKLLAPLEPMFSAFKRIFGNLELYLQEIWINIMSVAKNYWELIKNVILAPVLFVTSLISGGWEEAKNNMIQVWGNIKESAIEIWNGIQNIFTVVNEAIFSVLNDIWLGISGVFINIWTIISTVASETWTNIKAATMEIWANIQQWLSTTWNNINQTSSNVWSSLKNGVKQTWNDLKQWTYDTWENIKQFTKDTWNNIKQSTVNIVNGLVDGAKQAWEDLKRSVQNTIDTVKNIFDDLRSVDLFEIGKNIIQGLIDGIGNRIGAVSKKIKEIAGTIKDGIKGALDIHSPSRWMRRMIGQNIPLGVIEGMEDKQKELDKAVKKMVDLPTDLPTIQINPVKKNSDNLASDFKKTKKDSEKQQSGDVFNINLQSLGELSELQLMRMAEQLVKYIKDVKDREDAPKGGPVYGI